ncbi:MAG TPA: FtsX-like permease family protein [Oleiagrimonas sp.]|nr:FtsX-like permease family protein [Oleiagrimonas sp.]
MEIRPIVSSLRRHKITAALVALEIALTCAIVCNAVFLISQRTSRMHMQSGIVEHQLVLIRSAGGSHQGDHGKARTAADLAALRAIPGVDAVAAVNSFPFGQSAWNADVKIDPKQKQPTLSATEYYGEGLLNAFGATLVRGRRFAPSEYVDLQAALDHKVPWPSVGIVTQALAERMWPGEDPLGKPIYGAGSDENPLRVVGVVKSLLRPSLDDGDAAGQWSIVMPVRMLNSHWYVLRTTPNQRQRVLQAAVKRLKSIDPRRIIMHRKTFDEARAEFFQGDRAMTSLLLGVIIALLLVTALGIVGLTSFWVSQRRKQIGIRRAIGATRGDILHYFQTENFLIVTVGIALGVVLAYGINLFLMQHYELPRMPWVYLPVGTIALWILGQLAVLGPALRASHVPPVVATRSV